MNPESRPALGIDELARRAGTSTRNVRAMQTLGLLARPAMRGRIGVYGQEHLVRLGTVLRLQAEGYSLAVIGRLLDAWERGLSLGQVLGLEPAVTDGDPDDSLYGFPVWTPRRGRPALSVVPTTVTAGMGAAS
jgi:DNA-binding transcriptional MerR regulator